MEKLIRRARKPIIKSTVLRIILAVVILVLPINVMTLILTDQVVRNNRREILSETRNVLEMRGKAFEDMLIRAGRRLTFLSISEPEFIQLAAPVTVTGQNDGQLLTVTRRFLENIRIEYPWINVLFFRFPNRDYTIMAGFMPGDQRFFRQALEGLEIDPDLRRGDWESLIIAETGVIISRASWNQMIFGSIISLEQVLIELGYENKESGKVRFFTDREGNVLTESGRTFLSASGSTLDEMKRSDQYEVFVYSMPRYDIELIEIIRLGSAFDQMTVMTSVILLSVAILTVLLVIPLLLFNINRQVSQPLHRLSKGIRHVEQGDLDYRIETGLAGSEFEEINLNFNRMLDQVKDLKIDIYEKELERKDIALRYLTQQVQPHFILNAMNLIYSYEPEEYHLIQKMVFCLSKYYRYIVKHNQTFVTLEQEMEHIKNYFEIQEARFIGLFESRLDYDPGLAGALIPPLLIQNFAENAIKYALRIGHLVQINITARFIRDEGQPDQMQIEISDNGPGITDDVLAKIAEFQKTGVPQVGLGVGMQNTIERMKVLYDDKMSLRLRRGAQGRGTNVEIMLPVHFTNEV